MNFTITKEDYENSSKRFGDQQNCPFAMAFRRQFPDIKFKRVTTYHVYDESDETIARLLTGFPLRDYNELATTGVTFETKIKIF